MDDTKKIISERVDWVISQWLSEHIAGSPISQNTLAWNHLYERLSNLRESIADILTKESLVDIKTND